MAEEKLFEAFNDCVERIQTGETLDSCLQDYPEHAAYLNQMLQISALVHDAQVDQTELDAVGQTVRQQVLDRLDTIKNHKRMRRLNKFLLPLTAVASLVLVVGFVLVLAGPSIGNIFDNISRGLSYSAPLERVPPLHSTESTILATPIMPIGTQAAAMSTTTPMPTMGAISTAGAANIQVMPLTAGEIDDNANWDNYLLYRRNYRTNNGINDIHDVDITGRQIINVVNEQGLPVLGADVIVFNQQTEISRTRTYATGETLFFPKANRQFQTSDSYTVIVQKGDTAVSFTLNTQQQSYWRVVLNAQMQSNPQLDVLFLLDATGSMGDEIAQLQNNLLAITQHIDQLSVDSRYALVAYRDRGDEYVTKVYDFTPEVGLFQSYLNSVQAAGGGDIPESLNEALAVALKDVRWRGDDTIKLIFLVADAPPHLDYPNDYDYAQEMQKAAAMGIKIHPIASSGLPPNGEYIFRQIAQYTMGRFIFLTYQAGAASGAAGSTRSDLNVGTPSDPERQIQGDYTVEQLDQLVLRLINDEIAALSQPAAPQDPVQSSPAAPVAAPSAPLGQERENTLILLVAGLGITFGYLLRRPVHKRKNDFR